MPHPNPHTNHTSNTRFKTVLRDTATTTASPGSRIRRALCDDRGDGGLQGAKILITLYMNAYGNSSTFAVPTSRERRFMQPN